MAALKEADLRQLQNMMSKIRANLHLQEMVGGKLVLFDCAVESGRKEISPWLEAGEMQAYLRGRIDQKAETKKGS